MKPERIQSDDQLTLSSALQSLIERYPEWTLDDQLLRRRWWTPDGRSAAALGGWLMALAEATGAEPELSIERRRVEARLRLEASTVAAQARWIRAIEGEAEVQAGGGVPTTGVTS